MENTAKKIIDAPVIALSERNKNTGIVKIDEEIQQVKESIKEWKEEAKILCEHIKKMECKRSKILNTIKNMQERGLSKRTTYQLEDKLDRPYALILFNL